MDKVVVGQEDAKVALSVLFSMHSGWSTEPDPLHLPPNALVLGPTGVGKTHTLRTAARSLGVPFHVVDATSLAPTSFQGLQIPSMLRDFVHAAGHVESAQRGVLFIDEFDKLAYGEEQDVTNRHMRHVQRSLLKLLEGSKITLPDGDTFDTTGVRFVCGGAFNGIQEPSIRRKRPPEVSRRLANQDTVVSADVVSYGFLAELVARLPLLVHFRPLSYEDLRAILDNQHVTPCEIWRRYFRQFGKELTFDPDALDLVARAAADINMGARGLGQVLFSAMVQKAYRMDGSTETAWAFAANDVQGRVSTMGAPR